MKSRIILISFFLLSLTKSGWSVVKFANDEIREDIEAILQEHELVQSLYNHLSSSQFTYVIRYNELSEAVDGHIFTNGESLIITLKKGKGFPLAATFVHEAVHAIQFENGRIAFYKNKDGEWKSDNIDLWEEAEAFVAMLKVMRSVYKNLADLKRQSDFMWTLNKKYELYGLEEVITWLAKYYPGLSKTPKNNPAFGNGILEGGRFFYLPYKSESSIVNDLVTK